MLKKVSDVIAARIAAEGVRHVFLVPGGAAMHLNDSIGAVPGLEYVVTLHEHAAAVAAEAYAKVTSNLGVAMVTAGPGATNAMTGVASAWVNSSPCLFLSGQVKLADRRGEKPVRQHGLQEVDIVSAVQSLTKKAVTITDPGTIERELDDAIRLARSGRPGPVWIEVPLDVQTMMVETAGLPRGSRADDPAPARPVPHVARVASMLASAERPVILAGGGIRIAGATAEFLALADELGVPVLTTWVGCDLMPDDHPLFAGRPGSFAPRGANFAVQCADVLLTIGARWDLATTGFAPEKFGKAARRAAVDVDPGELAKLSSFIDVAIEANAGDFVRALRTEMNGRRPEAAAWRAQCQAWRTKYPVMLPEHRGRPQAVSTYLVMDVLSDLLGEGDLIVEGSSGIHSEIFFLAFRIKRNQRVVCDGSLGAMGYGLPASVGSCLASGRKRTVLIEGDGSFFPNVQELETIARLHLPVKIVVVNNDGYASIRASQERWFGRLTGADRSSNLSLPDIQRVAAAFGIPSVRAENESQLERSLSSLLATDGPGICEVMVPPEEDRVPRLASYKRADGAMESRPLEDMFPFLDPEEIQASLRAGRGE
jgi:acetolactate synthase-1/2/3 large subunit